VRPSDSNTDVPAGAPARARYHHGDVANALIREAVTLARDGGPEAVVLREAARRVGVSPAAAYRHLLGHENLLHAVKGEAQEALAEALELGVRIAEAEHEVEGEDAVLAVDRAEDAMRRAYGVGRAYVRFALAEPGLFRTALCRVVPRDPGPPGRAGRSRRAARLAARPVPLVPRPRGDPGRADRRRPAAPRSGAREPRSPPGAPSTAWL
jgi:AcrR family transcriptional regulator